MKTLRILSWKQMYISHALCMYKIYLYINIMITDTLGFNPIYTLYNVQPPTVCLLQPPQDQCNPFILQKYWYLHGFA